ncbi:MAG TPA: hypothetical protein VLK59_12415, partial [Solirubrobacteraceae bacterium]|nr:hypothetical protein [Solirubrobacteraceae bacterium]
MGGVRFRSALTAALVAALSTGVASAASASCSDTHLVPTRANSTRIEAATLCLVNLQRARHGERALRPNADLS